MIKAYFITLLLFIGQLTYAQYEYEPSELYPFGQVNPNAPEATKDFEPMIGECDCLSYPRNQDGTWAEPVEMIWRFKYIMNGMAVQDETLKMDGIHTGSIRQFNIEDDKWYVYYYTSKTITPALSTWTGNKTEDNRIVLYKDQKAPNGVDGFFRLTFYDIDTDGYKWIGEWTDPTETTVFPTWKIECKRQNK